MNGYDLSRAWFDWCFENPEKVSPNHTAIYFFAIEHCNRLGWKEKFGFPTQMSMDAIGIKKHQTYIKYFNDLCEWGFIKLIQKSTNQYSANIISLKIAKPKKGNALDNAFIKHGAKQTESNGQSNSSIDKQETINKETINRDFVDLMFLQPFEDWMNYKKSRKESYASIESEKAFYNKLLKLSGNNPIIAKSIIEQSMANNWAGIFPIKPQQSSGDYKLKGGMVI